MAISLHKQHLSPLPTHLSLHLSNPAYLHPSPTAPSLLLLSQSLRGSSGYLFLKGVWLSVSQLHVCPCVRVSLSPHPPSLLPAHIQQLCHLPGHFTSRCWQPSISVSITLPASPARCLHYLTNDIMPFCVPASACSPTHPSPTPSWSHSSSSSPFLIPISLHATVLPVVSPRMQGFITHQ